MVGERPAILTTSAGEPIPRPERSDYEPGLEGDIAWMRAIHSYNDRVTDAANLAFDAAFRKAMRR